MCQINYRQIVVTSVYRFSIISAHLCDVTNVFLTKGSADTEISKCYITKENKTYSVRYAYNMPNPLFSVSKKTKL